MATVNGTGSWIAPGVHKQTWTALASGDVGNALTAPNLPDKTVHLTGTFNTATCVIQGSNDGTNYETLADPNGNALSFTATGIETILENVQYIRPKTGTAGGSAAITVTVVSQSAKR